MPVIKCPLDRKKVDRLFNIIISLGILAFTSALLAYAVTGLYSRYWADDYCFSELIRNKGVWDGLTQFYNTISNRFGAFLLVALSEVFGSMSIRILPGLMILFFSVGLTWNAYGLLALLRLQVSKRISILFALIVTFFILFEAPNLFQSVYWRSGMVSYFAPLIIFTYITGILLWQLKLSEKKQSFWVIAILLLILAFLAGGTSETYAAFQTASLGIFFVGMLFWKRKAPNHRITILSATALLGSLLAMGVMIAAPGNQLRLNALQQADNFGTVIQLSLNYALDFIWYSVRGLPVPMLVSILIAWVLMYHISAHMAVSINYRFASVWLLAIPLIAYLLVAAVCAPTVYGMMAYPEERALMIARFIMVIGTILWGGLAGIASHAFMDHVVDTCMMSLFILGLLWIYPVRSSVQVWQQLPAVQIRAKTWDVREADIIRQRDTGITNLKVSAQDSIQGVYELIDAPQFWVNQCAARYYGVGIIRAINK